MFSFKLTTLFFYFTQDLDNSTPIPTFVSTPCSIYSNTKFDYESSMNAENRVVFFCINI